MTDPIADMIIRIKNAFLARQNETLVPHSKLKEAIAKLLVENGYLDAVELQAGAPQSNLLLKLKYVGKVPAITDVRRVSKPGRRLYSSASEIPQALGGYGLTVVSTSKGIMSGTQARQLNVGGEVLCQIW